MSFSSPIKPTPTPPIIAPVAVATISHIPYFNFNGFLMFCFFIISISGIAVPTVEPISAFVLSELEISRL